VVRACNRGMSAVRFLPAGDGALLVELDCLQRALALFHVVRQDLPLGVEELIPAARTLLVHYRPSAVSPTRLAGELRRLAARSDIGGAAGSALAGARLVEIPVRYDGEDLEAVAEWLGLTP